MTNLPFSEQWYRAATRWAELDAAANILEESKSAYLSQRMIALGDVPVSRAEATVKASMDWADYIERMVAARKDANLAKVEKEFLYMKYMEHHSAEANQRTQARL